MPADPTPDPTRAEAEQLALSVLVRAMREDKVPPPALQAALAVYPRTSAVPATKGAKGEPQGFATVHLTRHLDGSVALDDDGERPPLPGDVRPTP